MDYKQILKFKLSLMNHYLAIHPAKKLLKFRKLRFWLASQNNIRNIVFIFVDYSSNRIFAWDELPI
jgi:hypothetical protein